MQYVREKRPRKRTHGKLVPIHAAFYAQNSEFGRDLKDQLIHSSAMFGGLIFGRMDILQLLIIPIWEELSTSESYPLLIPLCGLALLTRVP